MGSSGATPRNHALVYGATGIQGWAVVNQLLEGYPTKNSFEKITALANRPPSENMLWPKNDKLQIISGINLLNDGGQVALEKQMKAEVPGIDTVTHVFFFAYIFKEDPTQEITTNVTLLQRAVTAAENLSPNLKFVLLPTGTKAYGVQCLANFPFASNLPLSEDLPRIPEPYQSQNFYYNQTDWLTSQSKGKEWTWCEVRPDVVVGFVPNNNVYCLAQTLATYLSCFREVEGSGAECVFPGTEKSWKILSNDSSQDVVARFCIHAVLNPEACGQGRAFNVADNSRPSTWEEKWPVICEFFGLRGIAPPKGGSGPQPGQYLVDHLPQWKGLEKKHGLTTGRVGNDRSMAGFQYFIMTMFDFDRQLDLSKQHKAWNSGGKAEEIDSKTAWWTAFERFRAAKIIP
ncbi:hypothetical protein LTR62_004044 [Meristemomyces frigidus]|uniref:PRISE-like Rossmann-fold domain-containing protein n=1 Tax=Meristemomyces frigidus TaxID=1508187 RepID=A0AAN7TR99_9PEZI|nr:hypothetical protein LTR62_004044 [Meristemomyces frigidus]